jgi:hypothetical protein
MSLQLRSRPLVTRSEPATAPSAPARIAAWWRATPGALIAYLGMATLLFAPAWAAPSARLIGPSGDPQQATWFLSWTPYAVGHGLNPLVTGHINAPVGVNLMWNTLMPLPGLLLWPVTALFGAVVSYNLLVTVGIALSAWCAFLAMRRYVDRDVAAFVGGALYGFSPFVLGQALGHPDLAFAAVPPLVLMLLDDLVTERRRASALTGLLLGLLAVAQMLVFEETLVSMAVAAATAMGVLAVLRRDLMRTRVGHVLRSLCVAMGTFVAVAAWPLAVQLFGPRPIRGQVQPHGLFVSDLLSPVVPTNLQLFAPSRLTTFSQGFSGNIVERSMYIGIPVLAIALYSAVRFRHRLVVRVAAISALLLGVLSLGPSLHVGGHDTGIPLPWRLLQSIPVLTDVLPSRLGQYVFLALAVLLAVFVDEMLFDRRTSRMGLAASAAALLTLLPLMPFPTTDASVPAFFTSAEVRRIPQGSTVLVAPYARDWNSVQPMLWQVAADMRFRLPEGYFLEPGPDGNAITGPLQSALGDALYDIHAGQGAPPVALGSQSRYQADLVRWGVGTVVVGPMDHQTETVAFLTWLLGRPPAPDQGVLVWWDVRVGSLPSPAEG